MLTYLDSIKNYIGSEPQEHSRTAELAISCLQDFYYNSTVIQYSPEKIALATVILTFQMQGVRVFEDENLWYSTFCETTHDEIWTIIDEIVKVYETDDAVCY